MCVRACMRACVRVCVLFGFVWFGLAILLTLYNSEYQFVCIFIDKYAINCIHVFIHVLPSQEYKKLRFHCWLVVLRVFPPPLIPFMLTV